MQCSCAISTLVLTLMSATLASAEVQFTLDKLDSMDGLPLPPASRVVVDLFVNVTSDDAYSAGGLNGSVGSGARLVYGYDDFGNAMGTAPGTADRFVSFLSQPRARNADARFGIGAAVGLLGYCTDPLVLDSVAIDAAGLVPAPHDNGRDGWVLRIAIDLSNVTDPAFQTDSADIVVSQTQIPGAVVLFETYCQGQFDAGAAVVTENGAYYEFGFGIYGIPEPGSVFLLLPTLWLIRRRC